MSHKSVQRGNRRYATPGTCNQKGNNAPRPRWPAAIRVLIHRIAHHLDFNDDDMSRLRKFPDAKTLYGIFIKTVPWFPDWYDPRYVKRAKETGWPEEKWELFSNGHGPEKVYNRLHYLFTEPKNGERGRRYGIGVEHPDNPQGNRRDVDAKCSVEIMRRLKLGLSISREEIEGWGK